MGDIVAIRKNGKLATHRVISINPEGFGTQGDNRPLPDHQPVPMELVEGRALFVKDPNGRWRRPTTPPRGRWWRNRVGIGMRNLLHTATRKGLEFLSMSERFETQDIGRELVVHDTRSGQVHVLNETAAKAWKALQSGYTQARLEAYFKELYPEQPAESIRQDILEMIVDFKTKGLLEDQEGNPIHVQ